MFNLKIKQNLKYTHRHNTKQVLDIQIQHIHQLHNILFYIQWYICQGNMFRPSRSSSGPPRKQIQKLFSFPALWDPQCLQDIVTGT